MTNKANKTKGTSKNLGGRPPKFSETSRPVTVTLPERILDKLTTINPDRAKAIVKVVDALFNELSKSDSPVQIVTMGEGNALIVVAKCDALQRVPFLRMIEIAVGKFLLAIPPNTSVEMLEIALIDLLEHIQPSDKKERSIIQHLIDLLRTSRRKKKVSKSEILFIDK